VTGPEPLGQDFTRSGKKRDLYRREVYFREAWDDAVQCWGLNAGDILARAGMVLIKPDGVLAGVLPLTLDYLDRYGFSVTACFPVSLGRIYWRELWRYQINGATLDRLAVNDKIMTAGSSLMLAIRSDTDADLPATSRLSRLKGASIALGGDPGSLRELLGQTSSMLSLIHTSDEPADLIRELGILLDSARRRAFLASLVIDRTLSVTSLLADVDAAPSADIRRFDVEESLSRIWHALLSHPKANSAALRQIAASVKSMQEGEATSWRHLADAIEQAELGVDMWDVIVIGAHFITYNLPGIRKELGGFGNSHAENQAAGDAQALMSPASHESF
jgi:nucleoside diphosphate kinase